MSTVESILDLLNKWPKWKRVTESPDRLDAIEQRIAALESKLQRAPGETCPGCGKLTYRAVSERPDPGPLGLAGMRLRTMKCEDAGCGYTTDVPIVPR